MNETSLNRYDCFSSGVTSLATVLPPSLVRSFAMPASICAKVTYTMPSFLDQSVRHPYSMPMPTSCRQRPLRSVLRIPLQGVSERVDKSAATEMKELMVSTSESMYCTALSRNVRFDRLRAFCHVFVCLIDACAHVRAHASKPHTAKRM